MDFIYYSDWLGQGLIILISLLDHSLHTLIFSAKYDATPPPPVLIGVLGLQNYKTIFEYNTLNPTSLGFGPGLASSNFFVKSKLNLEQMFDLGCALVKYSVAFKNLQAG